MQRKFRYPIDVHLKGKKNTISNRLIRSYSINF